MGKNEIKQVLMQAQMQIDELRSRVNFLDNKYNPKAIETKYKTSYRNMIQGKDRILCSNRYIWKNLPYNIPSNLLENFFYEYGSLVFFVDGGELKIAHYANSGKLNQFGQLDEVIPIGFNGESYGRKVNIFNYKGAEKNTVGVTCNDYTSGTNYCIPRCVINKDTTINDETEVYAQIITNVKTAIHKAIALCDNAEQANYMREQVKDILSTNNPIPVFAGSKDELNNLINILNLNTEYDPQPFCQLIDYYNKTRRAYNGVPTPDTFEKRERLISAEVEDTSAHVELVLLDGYYNRKNAIENIKKYLQFDGVENIDVEINQMIYDVSTDNIDKNEREEKIDEKTEIKEEIKDE